MQPVAFAGCFGWLHWPASHIPLRGPAVVLCHPLGNEAICTHREWMALAGLLAAQGMPALRFDYRSCGDSLDLADPAGPDTWQNDIRAAMNFLRAQTGIERIALCGLRLGATLAMRAAQDCGGVAALALLAPCVSGRAYGRELRMAAGGSNLAVLDPPPAADSDQPLNSNGFLWPAAMLGALERIDLAQEGALPAPYVLLLQKGAGKPAARLAAWLRGAGAETREESFPGFDELMHFPIRTAVPTAAFGHVVDFLSGLPAGSVPTRQETPEPPSLSDPSFIETPLCFGPDGSLFGMLCEPVATGRDVAVLMVHTGTSHHIGNGRMLVEIARRLSARGIASFRIDVGGMGDSAAHAGDTAGPLYGPRGPEDVGAAIDTLQDRGHGHVVVMGLCAGAYLAFHAAVRDPRIAGLIAINLQCFAWEDGRSLEIAIRENKRTFASYLQSMKNPGEWRRVLRGDVDLRGIAIILLRRFLQRIGRVVGGLRPARSDSPLHAVWAAMDNLKSRGASVRFVYSDNDPGLDEIDAHFGRGGRRLRQYGDAALVRLPNADHNLNAVDARRRFVAWLDEFLDRETRPIIGG